MELMPIDVEPSCRVAWVSEDARALWEPAINRISQTVEHLELLSVEANHRRCAWRTVDEAELPDFSKRCAKMGLRVFPVRRVGKWNGFAHKTPQLKPGQPASVYSIIYKNLNDAMGFLDAFEKADHNKQGEYLGFPACCRSAFAKNWKRGFVDPIWQWAGETSEIIKADPYSNPLLRYIGIRVGFHIPCGPNCDGTISLSDQRVDLLNDKEGRETVQLMNALLSMPMSWDAYHGMAIVRTPLFQIIASTVPTSERYFVRIEGSFWPREGLPGTVYPYCEAMAS